ncbi:AMP-binding protein [Alteromonas lipolytica]|uniref:Uncharacterized protein n=1 Tax=Alteromonas lipolytica TaxID=1856405 RepID=A0A1E8FD48_9ALTE|nr:AMP-binding protein [Alteromonas lipolytica]OFI33508.1 hypothetical protein BFC17_04420 [Alteromonas lipolytica]GGF59047.1 acyl-CoA synthetase [Alteromonas lipolytica]
MSTLATALKPDLFQCIADMAASQPDAPALVHLDNPLDTSATTISYGELFSFISALAAELEAAGVTAEHSVAILLPTIPESLMAFVAAATVATAFPLNPLLTPQALAEQLSLANAHTCIVFEPSELMPIQKKLLAALDYPQPVKQIVEVSSGFPQASSSYPEHIPVRSWQELVQSERRWQPKRPAARRVAALFHTGGTSGSPKLAELGESALAAGPQLSAQASHLQATDRILNFLPYFHVGGTLSMGIGLLTRGGAFYTCGLLGGRNPDLIKQIWTLCANHHITMPTMVPTSWSAVLDNAEGKPPACLRGIITGGAAAPLELVERAESITGVPMSQVFGMTEFAGICTAQPVDGKFRAHAVGYPPHGVELKLNAIGEDLFEVHLKGPNLFLGYRTKDGRVNAPDEWLATGDLGRLDDSGQLQLVGRSKDVIIRSGHNIDPAMIEEAAYAHPHVLYAAAIGLPDAYAGEVPVLFIVKTANGDLSNLQEVLEQNIADAPAKPRRIIVVDELPQTPVGKIERYRLRQQAAVICARELLADLVPAEIQCTDNAARTITITWPVNTSQKVKQDAEQRLRTAGLQSQQTEQQ